MHSDFLALTRTLTDDELQARAKSLAARARDATAQLVAHLVEIEARGLHLAAGYSSLFAYCRHVLSLSENETYNRIAAARVACRFPVILERLAQGAINLTTVSLLAPHLTPANHLEALKSARGLRKSEVEELVARLAPKPDVPASLRKLPATPIATFPAPTPLPTPAATPEAPPAAPTTTAPGARASATRALTPLSPDRYKLQLTISGDTVEKLRLAQDLLRHADPSGDQAAIIDRALTLLLHDLAKHKFAATDRPAATDRRRSPGDARSETPDAGFRSTHLSCSRHIPADVQRTVFVRDLGRCAFTSAEGRRCNERAFVEFHHVRPYAHDGPPTVANIQLRCQAHNAHEWRREVVDVRIREADWHHAQDMEHHAAIRRSRQRAPEDSPGSP